MTEARIEAQGARIAALELIVVLLAGMAYQRNRA